ncbi:MAG: conserved repeat domain protein [Verrucomicrobiales bacterium]|nr:conserved repeat domain protein [Verrucomicrobiales bacterium]
MLLSSFVFRLDLLRGLLFTFTALLALAFGSQATAQSSTPALDLSFNTAGIPNGYINVLALQPDGKVLVGGSFTNSLGQFLPGLVRLLFNGQVDTSFNVPSTVGLKSVYRIGLQSDGKIVVSGNQPSFNQDYPALIRLETNGWQDTTFGTPVGGQFVGAIAIQPDDLILIGGTFTNVSGIRHPGLARLQPNGTLDFNFHPNIGTNPIVNAIAINSLGQILAGGSYNDLNGYSQFALHYIAADGTYLGQINQFDGYISTIQFQMGYILIAGNFDHVGGIFQRHFARLNGGGGLDASFLNGGIGVSYIGSIAVQTNSKVLLTGSFTNIAGAQRSGFARLNSDGTIDSVYNPSLPADPSQYEGLLLQPDGKLLVSDVVSNLFGVDEIRLLRLQGDTPDFVRGPAIVGHPTNQTVLADAKVVLSANAAGFPLQFQWLFNGAPLPGMTNSNLTIPKAEPEHAGVYKLVASNALGTATSQSATLTVNVVVPSIQIQPTNQAVLAGVDVSFTVVASGNPAPAYQWFYNGSPLTSQTNATLFLSGSSNPQAGVYKVRVQNVAGSVSSQGATLTLNYLLPSITSQPGSMVVTQGLSAFFSVIATGAPSPSLQWIHNGAAILGATNPTLTLLNVSTNQAGVYTVRASNVAGVVTSLPATLTVTPFLSFSEALDTANLVWTSGGTLPWIAQTNTSHDNRSALQSGAITDSQESWIETTVNGPGTISFWWKVDSENGFDQLQFAFGDAPPQIFISGQRDWARVSLNVPAEAQRLRWRYVKDDSSAVGLDRGWLDQVEYLPFGLARIQFPSPGTYRIYWNAPLGQAGIIETSTNLGSWIVLTNFSNSTNPASASGLVPAKEPRRFFRAKLLP